MKKDQTVVKIRSSKPQSFSFSIPSHAKAEMARTAALGTGACAGGCKASPRRVSEPQR